MSDEIGGFAFGTGAGTPGQSGAVGRFEYNLLDADLPMVTSVASATPPGESMTAVPAAAAHVPMEASLGTLSLPGETVVYELGGDAVFAAFDAPQEIPFHHAFAGMGEQMLPSLDAVHIAFA
jgi:hypothetical protein